MVLEKSLKNGCIVLYEPCHPQRPRDSQSGWEKRRDESIQVWVEEPLGTDYHQTIPNDQANVLAPDWAQKMLCIIVPNRRTASPEFFLCVHTQRLLSHHTCLVH